MNLEDVIQRGTRASQPAANTVAAGTLYFVTGENVFERSSGSAWESVSSGGTSGGTGGSGLSAGFALSLLGSVEEAEIILIPGPAGPTGPTGATGGAGTSNLKLDRITLTNAQLITWSSAPIQMVAAQGADKIVIPVHFSLETTVTAGFSSTPTFSLVHNGSTTNLLVSSPGAAINNIRTECQTSYNTNLSFVYPGFDPRNKAVMLKGSANPTGAGNMTGVANIAYLIIQVT